MGLPDCKLLGVKEQSSFSESEPSELISDTNVITSGASDLERVRPFRSIVDFESKFKSFVVKRSLDPLSQLILRVFSFRLRDFRLLAKNVDEFFDDSSKLRTGADIARTKGGRFRTVSDGDALKLLGFCMPLFSAVELL